MIEQIFQLTLHKEKIAEKVIQDENIQYIYMIF